MLDYSVFDFILAPVGDLWIKASPRGSTGRSCANFGLPGNTAASAKSNSPPGLTRRSPSSASANGANGDLMSWNSENFVRLLVSPCRRSSEPWKRPLLCRQTGQCLADERNSRNKTTEKK